VIVEGFRPGVVQALRVDHECAGERGFGGPFDVAGIVAARLGRAIEL